ncbi:MAG: hypothetical protein P4L49_02710 [Desulfosporosinus sp.]|nr:hypothetical protein [Desulfosporosinus sp.]
MEKTREQTTAFWDQLGLPKKRPTSRKQKPSRPKGSRNERLRVIAYKQAEERDAGTCVVCGGIAQQHHHIIRQSTGYAPEYLQRIENVVLVCVACHTMGVNSIHGSNGNNFKQKWLEEWQRKYYPEYAAMMQELAKVTGCRDEQLINSCQRLNV